MKMAATNAAETNKTAENMGGGKESNNDQVLDDDMKGENESREELREEDSRGPAGEMKEVFNLNTKVATPLYAPDIDLTWLLLMGLASSVRLLSLTKPNSVVFDEVHFGRFTSYFMQGRFFFDVHPPLGKLLYAVAGFMSGFDGSFQFESIGQAIPNDVLEHIYYLRIVPALFSVLLVPTVYEIVRELGSSYWFAVFGALLVCFENMIVVQSRFVLLDSPMLFFIALSLCCYIKFIKEYRRPFEVYWWVYLISLGVSLACTLSIKYSGFFTVILLGGITCFELWMMIIDPRMAPALVYKHILSRFFSLIVVPIFLYLLQFYVMFEILKKAGPHDSLMSSAFQRTLQGGLGSITQNQSQVVAYGSQITLRNTHSKQCWLHSHQDIYPIKYPDGRGSSAQQQVTCYAFKDVNNWWIVKHPKSDNLQVDFPPRPIMNGDVVHLVHGTTGRGLNSHDVAAPLTPTLMEVSGYIDHNVSMDAQFGWRVEIINPDASNKWKAIESQIRLVHVNRTASLRVSGGILPDWGYHQFEVGTDRMIKCDQCVWNVEEHNQNISMPQNISQEEAQKILAERREESNKIVDITFLEKFWEYQMRMFKVNTDLVQGHAFASRPHEWPLMRRGIAYWIDQTTNKQIFCIGNPFIWWAGSLAVFFYITLLLLYLLRRRRKIYDIDQDQWNLFVIGGYLLIGGYLINFIPFFPVEKTLFVHSYLPALLFKILAIPIFINHFNSVLFNEYPPLQAALKCCCVAYTLLVIWSFNYFSPFTYGTKHLNPEEINAKKWIATWDFLSHTKT